MNKPSRIKNNNRRNPLLTGMPSWLTSLLPTMLLGLTLTACDSVPTEETVNTGGGNTVTGYTGDACGTGATDPNVIADACNFKIEFWDKMPSVSQCANCHDTAASGQSPYFLDSTDVNIAFSQMLTFSLVNRSDVSSSSILSKISNGHNCGDTNACNALATTVEGYLDAWINGSAPSGGGTSNDIVLEVPTIKDAGESKTLPPAPGNFETTVWPLLTANCSNCHREAAPIPQAPFFSEADVDAAYAAILSSQKINLDDPANSRLVVRMRQEFHNCWDPNATGSTDCAGSATAMQDAITAFAGSVPLSTVDSNWKLSKAMNISDGQIASGGARDDSSTIALYKFQSGAGSKTILDISGVGTALNLDLYGTEDVDYKWVGGWGIEFVTPNGKAQGTTQLSTKLRDYITASGEYSIEAWVVPGNVTQGDANDPARIISYSAGINERNFTLGQAEYRYSFMNRSSSTDDNGETALLTDDDDEDLQATQQHVVVTFSPVNGRKVYVNGVDVSLDDNAGAGSTDPVTPAGSLSNWDDTFAFILGNEASNNKAWAGKLRLVAIHNRAMTQTQITQNFDAGVGEKFFVLFSVSEQMGDPNCIVAGVHQCFVYFVVSQFDSYSYLFDKPTFISLNPAFVPSGTVIKGMRIGLNGKEPAVGQAYANINTTINGTDYTTTGQVLSSLGTIIALEKGADDDEFFLTFEDIDGNQNTRTANVCGVNMTCTSTPQDGTPAAEIGLRTFEEILASMAAMTGVDPYSFPNVLGTYAQFDPSTKLVIGGIKQQLPSVEMASGFLSAHQMGVAQLAIAYCDALVETPSLRDSFFGSFGFDQPITTAYGTGDSAAKNQIVDALYDKMLGYPDPANGNATLANMPSRAEIKLELIGPGGNNLFDTLASNCAAATTPVCVTDAARTRAVTKAMCTAVLGSAGMLIQ